MTESFNYIGAIAPSKSMLNRLLIVQSFFPDLTWSETTAAEDVVLMRAALADFARGRNEFDCGGAGTVLRFLALRVARETGRFVLRGRSRLFERPQVGLLKVLRQLGVEAELGRDALCIHSRGWWPQGDAVHVPMDQSSQYASGLLLSAWRLERPLFLALGANPVSGGYWQWTRALATSLGMTLEPWGRGDLRVPARQTVQNLHPTIEPDMSSAFVVAALAALCGSCTITNLVWPSLQPDGTFVSVLESMGVPLVWSGKDLTVRRASRLQAIDLDLGDRPDMLPVLAVLASFAEGTSRLYNVGQAALKESNRLRNTRSLLELSGVECATTEDSLVVRGDVKRPPRDFAFAVDQDHRMAMAAGLLMKKGFRIELDAPSAVDKSFPDFWACAGLTP
jgi:3-phosphoshikimate 1-carboxyvinyltransferase